MYSNIPETCTKGEQTMLYANITNWGHAIHCFLEHLFIYIKNMAKHSEVKFIPNGINKCSRLTSLLRKWISVVNLLLICNLNTKWPVLHHKATELSREVLIPTFFPSSTINFIALFSCFKTKYASGCDFPGQLMSMLQPFSTISVVDYISYWDYKS